MWRILFQFANKNHETSPLPGEESSCEVQGLRKSGQSEKGNESAPKRLFCYAKAQRRHTHKESCMESMQCLEGTNPVRQHRFSSYPPLVSSAKLSFHQGWNVGEERVL